ncbi:hypothetical protein BH09ACT8_BH09ACT8_14220 [soil metagenome]
MYTVLYFSPQHTVYETRVFDAVDIAELVDGQQVDSLASADRQFDFWFDSSLRGNSRPVNLEATEVLLATPQFSPRTVPLLRGGVVVATHHPDGTLGSITNHKLAHLAQCNCVVLARHERALACRIAREDHRRLHLSTAGPAEAARPASS